MEISRTSDYSVAVLLHINELMCILPMDRQSCSNNRRSIDANNFVAYVQGRIERRSPQALQVPFKAECAGLSNRLANDWRGIVGEARKA